MTERFGRRIRAGARSHWPGNARSNIVETCFSAHGVITALPPESQSKSVLGFVP